MKEHVRFFEIPDNEKKTKRKLVDAVPSDWALVSGEMLAPSVPSITSHTGFRFISCMHQPEVISSRRDDEPDFIGLMTDRKLPAFVRFERVNDRRHFAAAKCLIVSLLNIGYGGHLRMYRDIGEYRHEIPAQCQFHFDPWVGANAAWEEEKGPQPARLKLIWNENYHGKEEDVAPVLAACRKLKLFEYKLRPLSPRGVDQAPGLEERLTEREPVFSKMR